MSERIKKLMVGLMLVVASFECVGCAGGGLLSGIAGGAAKLGGAALRGVGAVGRGALAVGKGALGVAGRIAPMASNVLGVVGQATGSPGVGLAQGIVGDFAGTPGPGAAPAILNRVAGFTGDPNVGFAAGVTGAGLQAAGVPPVLGQRGGFAKVADLSQSQYVALR